LAISPPSDIVLDVLRAADPLQTRAAAERLNSLAVAGTSEVSETFEDVFETVQAGTAELLPFDAAGALTQLRNQEILTTARPLDPGGKAEPYVRFEAFVLQSFIESMLPKSEAVFGPGNTGAIWKTLLAEKLAEQFARSGGIGIADSLAAARLPAVAGGG
jgi:hypothetical protein